VFIHGVAIDEDIIKEHKDKLSQMALKYLIHQTFKYDRSISQAKKHDHEFIVPIINLECHLINILKRHSDLVVTRSKVYLRKDSGTNQLLQEFVY
jgi:hypothetical protein